MNYYSTIAEIKIKDKLNLTYSVCEIEYIIKEDESYKFIFKPNYNIIELTNDDFFQGIPGLNLELKKEEYVRENIMPVFISERCPMKNRENLYEELMEAGLDYYNPLEWLINTDYKYSGDNFFVERKNDNKVIKLQNEDFKKNVNLNLKNLLNYICQGYNVFIEDIEINDKNRKEIYIILKKLYYNSYFFFKDNTQKVGRKKKDIDPLFLYSMIEEYKNNKISVEEVCKKLNVSRSTFFRILKEYNNEYIKKE